MVNLSDFSATFFFSSRRRHTRYIGDWSSDVCSSDLPGRYDEFVRNRKLLVEGSKGIWNESPARLGSVHPGHWPAGTIRGGNVGCTLARSEERRVGKEWRARRRTDA